MFSFGPATPNIAMSFTMLFYFNAIIKSSFTLIMFSTYCAHGGNCVSTESISTTQSWLALRVLKLTVIAARPLLTQLVMAVTISSQVPLPMILALNRTVRSVWDQFPNHISLI